MNLLQFVGIALLMCWSLSTDAQNFAPQIENLQAEVDTTIGKVFISYDLADSDNLTVAVYLRVSGDHGQSWLINTSKATGDVGKHVPPGKNKRIVWPYSKGTENPLNYIAKLVVDDGEKIDLQTLTSKVSPERISKDLSALQGVRHYLKGAPGLKIATDLIYHRFFELNLSARKQTFMLGGYEGQNLIGIQKGQITEPEVLLLMAHYDTHEESPGANDNASGIAAMLEAARVLSEFSFQKSIQYLAVDLQKQGGIGARKFVRNLSTEELNGIEVVYNLDNVGVYSSKTNTQQFTDNQKEAFPELSDQLKQNKWRGDFAFAVANSSGSPYTERLERLAKATTPDLTVRPLVVSAETEKSLFGNRAYEPFKNADIPFVLLSDGAQTRCTTYETAADWDGQINIEKTSQLVEALIASVASESQLIHGDIKTTDIKLRVVKKLTTPVVMGLVDFQLYLTHQNEKLKVRITHPQHGNLQLKLMDTAGEVYYYSKTDLYYASVINIDVSYLDPGVYIVNLTGTGFNELKEFIMP